MKKQIKSTALAGALIFSLSMLNFASVQADSDVANQKSKIYGQAISIEELVDTSKYENQISALEKKIERLESQNAELRAAADYNEKINDFSESEWILITKVVVQEAGYKSVSAQKNVAYVIFNRMKSDRFPNTVKEVLYAPGQFESVSNGAAASRSINDDLINIVKEAYVESTNGEVAQGALFFARGMTVGRTYLFTDEVGHMFCK